MLASNYLLQLPASITCFRQCHDADNTDCRDPECFDSLILQLKLLAANVFLVYS